LPNLCDWLAEPGGTLAPPELGPSYRRDTDPGGSR
jgi:hypothetical protein